jgi:AMP nucleosidase
LGQFILPADKNYYMKSKEEIVQNWLPRYTGEKLENFGQYILLTNFSNYVNLFAEWNNVEVIGAGKPMQCATANNISIINFGMGSPTAALLWIYYRLLTQKQFCFWVNAVV